MNKYLVYFNNFKKYYYLLTILVRKDLYKKYKGSYLGILWSLLNPLFNMIVISIVFSTLFRQSIENYPVYYLSGFLLFSFFSTSTSSSLKSVISASSLLKKVYIPKYIPTLSNIIANFIFFLISLIVLILAIIVFDAKIGIYAVYAPIYLILFFVFCCGISLILATITVFFRDIEHLYGVFTSVLVYASAIFYPSEIVPEKYQFILHLNPIYHFIQGFRNAVYFSVPIDIYNLLICFILAAISIATGVLVFEKNQDKFIQHL